MSEQKILNVRFQQKYDTAANWKDSSIVLLAGEIAIESDTGKFKVGNGSDVFADLDYFGMSFIEALQAVDEATDGRLQALEGTVNNPTTGVVATFAVAGKNATDITNLQEAVNNTYTKTAADTKFVAQEEGKSLLADSEIERLATLANYNDTEVRDLISNNADAIENITKENGAIDAAVAAEALIARAAEQKNADDIVAINALLNTISDTDDITSLKELALWVEEHGEDAAEMAKGIDDNAKAIAAINNADTGVLATAIAHSDANLATAKSYTDTEISTLASSIHTVDNETIKLNENKAYVAKVSTDLLAQGAVELILSAGNASGYTVV